MTYSFNLIDQPWIPCVMSDGSRTELGLRDTLFQAHEIREIFDQSPLVTAALHRLLLAILHRNFGPTSRLAWRTLWQAKRLDNTPLGSYMSEWYGRFDLFDDIYPFYQAAGLAPATKVVKEVEVNDLLPELARGNNRTLFDHTTDETSPSLSPSESIRAVVALQSYKLGGLSGLRSNYVDAPLARPIYFLVKGATLFETLLLNLIPYHGDDPIPRMATDLPAWEREGMETSDIPHGYLDYLTWQTLSLRLLPSRTPSGGIEIRRTYIGLGRDKFEHGKAFDPGCSYAKNPNASAEQRPWSFQRYKQDRMLWRDSAPLFRSVVDQEGKSLGALGWISGLVTDGILNENQSYSLTGYGQCSDQADVLFWRTEHLPLPVQFLADEHLVESLEGALKTAEAGGKSLRRAANKLACYILYPLVESDEFAKQQKDEVGRLVKHLGATESYWSVLEVPFLKFMCTLPYITDPDAALGNWSKRIHDSAFRAFDEATHDLDQSARMLRAIAQSRDHLDRLLRKSLAGYR